MGKNKTFPKGNTQYNYHVATELDGNIKFGHGHGLKGVEQSQKCCSLCTE